MKNEALFSLGWQSARDGVSLKILLVVQPKKHYPLTSVKMSNQSKLNNGVNEAGVQVKVSRLAGIPFVSRMGPIVIELLLIGEQREEMVSRKEQSNNAML